MSRVIDGYISTAEAIDKIVSADRDYLRLRAVWEKAARDSKNTTAADAKEARDAAKTSKAKKAALAVANKAYDKAFRAVSDQQVKIVGRLLDAIRGGALQPIVLTHYEDGCWRPDKLPRVYWERVDGEMAIRTGSLKRVDLDDSDKWARNAALYFCEADFNAWCSPRSALATDRPSEGEMMSWAKPILARIDAAGRQQRRKDFNAMLREKFSEQLPKNVLDALWELSAPEKWRQEGQGPLPASKRVDDWHNYLAL